MDKKDLVAKIQVDRLLQAQELGWLFRPLALCPFPAKPLKSTVTKNGKEVTVNETIWQRRSGNITISITADPRTGIPYGQDILVVLYLAIEARKQGSRRIKVNFYRDFTRLFNMNPDDGRKYRLVQQSMARIRNALYKWEIDHGTKGSRETGGNYLYIEEWDLHFDPKNPDQPPLWDQYILLSERFWYEVQKHKIPFNVEAARHLKTKPAHLSFYLWLSYRVWCAWKDSPGHDVLIPYWGDFGLQNQMSSTIANKNDFRPEVKKWMAAVRDIWPLCPVEIVGDALRIFVSSEDQLDILPRETDAPRILPRGAAAPHDAQQSTCPNCGALRTQREGKRSMRGYRMPDYWHCSGEKCREKTESVDAICRECGATMRIKNKGKSDYSYTCKCGHIEAGEAYWYKYSCTVKVNQVNQ